jgi:hypothetical protein
MKNKIKTDLVEAMVGQFHALSWRLPEYTEEDHKRTSL